MDNTRVTSLSGFLTSKKLLPKKLESRDRSESSRMASEAAIPLTPKPKATYRSELENEEDGYMQQPQHKLTPRVLTREAVTPPTLNKWHSYQEEAQFSRPEERHPRNNSEYAGDEGSYRHHNASRRQTDQPEDRVPQYFPQRSNMRYKNQPAPEQQYPRRDLSNRSPAPQVPRQQFLLKKETFEGSRLEARQLLDDLSLDLKQALNRLNKGLDSYHKNMQRTINQQYGKLQQAIKIVVEEIFSTNEKKIKDLYIAEEQRINAQLYVTQQDINQLYESIENMKMDLEGPNWRKATAEILASDLESRVSQALDRIDRIGISREIRMQFDHQAEREFGEALERLLELRPWTPSRSMGMQQAGNARNRDMLVR